MAEAKRPYFLFAPLSTDLGGTGEYMRCLIVANALRQNWPGSRIDFVLHEKAPYFGRHPYGKHTFSGHHKDKAAKERKLRLIYDLLSTGEKPDAVFFDGTGRTGHYRRAFQRKIPVVHISSKPYVIRKGFNFFRLLATRQHWILRHVPGQSQITVMQRALAGFFRVRLVEFDALYNEPDPSEATAALREIGVREEDPFILFIPGGGTYRVNGKSVVDIFLEAAAVTHRTTGNTCIVIGKSEGDFAFERNGGVRSVEYLENHSLIALIRRAKLCVCGGGNMISQPLANRKLVVAAPLGRPDQADRVSLASGMGILVSAEPFQKSIASKTVELLGDDILCKNIVRKCEELKIGNGLGIAVRAVENLLR